MTMSAASAARRGGWSKAKERVRKGVMCAPPSEDCAWENMLAKTGIARADALRAIGEGWPGSGELEQFARRMCYRRFIPEDVLAMLGLRSAVERNETLNWTGMRVLSSSQVRQILKDGDGVSYV
jgi:hypothetical protein